MKKSNKVYIVSFVMLVDLIICLPSPAAAYIDPNTGNLIYQILFPVFTAILTFFVICKNKIRNKIKDFICLFKKKKTG